MARRKDDFGKFGMELRTAAEELGRAQRGMVEGASREIRDALNAEIRRDTGGDSNMSRFHSGRGASVHSYFTIIGEHGALGRVKVKGPIAILESGTKAHAITPKFVKAKAKKGELTRVQAKRLNRQRQLDQAFGGAGGFAGQRPMFLAGLGIWRYRVNDHPGAKGKGTFTRGAEIGLAKASKNVDAYFSKAFNKAFGG